MISRHIRFDGERCMYIIEIILCLYLYIKQTFSDNFSSFLSRSKIIMKSAYIIVAVGAFVASVQAQCECDPADSACLNECGMLSYEKSSLLFIFINQFCLLVGNTNDCISECRSNECYSRCISYHWPGAEPNSESNRWEQPTSTWQKESSSTWATPTSSWTNNGQSSVWQTTSVWVPSSQPTMGQSSQWSQSNGWPSSATTWAPGYSYSGTIPSASTSASTSGSLSTYQMSKAILGVSLAAAAYILQ